MKQRHYLFFPIFITGTLLAACGGYTHADTKIKNGPKAEIVEGKQISVHNEWQKVIDNRLVHIFAGAMEDDPEQGVVIIRSSALDLSDMKVKEIRTPQKHGSLTVISTSNNAVILAATDGFSYLLHTDTWQLEFHSILN